MNQPEKLIESIEETIIKELLSLESDEDWIRGYASGLDKALQIINSKKGLQDAKR